MIQPKKLCLYCQTLLVRHRSAGGIIEPIATFKKRKYCGTACYNLHRTGKCSITNTNPHGVLLDFLRRRGTTRWNSY